MTHPQKTQREKGQSLVEMAVGVTFLLLLLSGIVDLGRAFFSYIAIRDAAQEGALYGSYSPADVTGIAKRVRSSSSYPVNLNNTTDISVNTSLSGAACAGNAVTVTVQYKFPISMPFIGAVIGRQMIPLKAAVTDTILRPKCVTP
ncbi:MAG TPA: TadE/TadG family type IV pilus assembly protein [Anaerolineaceae bacterium]|nr:TadE/TadG family type IV pilus assembly protein [Anaerolineaceae bacterium]